MLRDGFFKLLCKILLDYKMTDYRQEQLMVIITTTLSLLTAWSWNSVLQQYIDQYYGRSLSTRVLSAVVITTITFLLISWLLKHFQINEQELKTVQKAKLAHYVTENNSLDS